MKKSNRYIAGLFDGEGCIQIKVHRTCYQLYVSINQTYVPILVKIQSKFGGAVNRIDTHKYKNAFNKKPLYSWVVGSKMAFNFLTKIYCYLEEKKEEAKVGIEFQEEIIKKGRSRWNKVTTSDCKKRESYRKKLQLLKRRMW